MQQWGGQLYWAFPFCKVSLVRAMYDSEHSSLPSKILNHKCRDLLFEPSLQQSAISFFSKLSTYVFNCYEPPFIEITSASRLFVERHLADWLFVDTLLSKKVDQSTVDQMKGSKFFNQNLCQTNASRSNGLRPKGRVPITPAKLNYFNSRSLRDLYCKTFYARN